MIKEGNTLVAVSDEDIELLKSNPKKFWEGVTNIGLNAFFNCYRLESIELPDSVEEIGGYAFYGCENLKQIKFLGRIINVDEKYFPSASFVTEHLVNKKDVSFDSLGKIEELRKQGIVIPNEFIKNRDDLNDCLYKYMKIY